MRPCRPCVRRPGLPAPTCGRVEHPLASTLASRSWAGQGRPLAAELRPGRFGGCPWLAYCRLGELDSSGVVVAYLRIRAIAAPAALVPGGARHLGDRGDMREHLPVSGSGSGSARLGAVSAARGSREASELTRRSRISGYCVAIGLIPNVV
jgi:hypothetical protein